MGLFRGLMGHASEVSSEDIQQEYIRILANNEIVERAYKLIRDVMIFTNKRLILIDKQGVTAKKIEYLSIPYRSIERFSVETVGHFDLDAELNIWVRGMEEPITKEFNSSLDIYEVQSVLAKYI